VGLGGSWGPTAGFSPVDEMACKVVYYCAALTTGLFMTAPASFTWRTQARTQVTFQLPSKLLFEMPGSDNMRSQSGRHGGDADDDAVGINLDVQQVCVCPMAHAHCTSFRASTIHATQLGYCLSLRESKGTRCDCCATLTLWKADSSLFPDPCSSTLWFASRRDT
jgi:hypothetical protein